MIVKIYGESGRWTIFDNVDYVDFGITLREVHSYDEFNRVLEDIALSESAVLGYPEMQMIFITPRKEWKKSSEMVEYRFCHLVLFRRNEVPLRIVFDTKAFLCNDNGKTIESVYVTGGNVNVALTEPLKARSHTTVPDVAEGT